MAVSQKMVAFSQRASWIRKMFEQGTKLKAQYGADKVFDFSLGNPDLPPPPEFHKALAEVVAAEGPGSHAYMPNGGYPSVRAAVAARLAAEQQVALGEADILMTCGAAGGLNVVLKALLDPGDEVIIFAPFFVEYNFYIDNHGGVTRVVATDGEFNLDLAALEAALTPRTKAVLINSPNNPTGQIYPADTLAALGRLLQEAGERFGTTIFLLADEPYRKIVFDGNEVPPVMALCPNSIVVSSYSKDLSLPGERIGYIAVHPSCAERALLLEAMTLANRILGFVNAPALMQRVVARLQGASVDNAIYTRRRELFCSILAEAGYEFLPPRGAFYIFPKSPIEDEVAFVDILQKHRVLAVPGRGFGMPGYFRLAFCVEDKVIAGAAEAFRLARLEALGG